MLISKVPDNEGGKGEGPEVPDEDSDSHEYQTANELFELMAKNQNFDTSDVDKLTTRDLVLLYKNIDLGTKLMSNANELKRRKPNQHVESVVYNDELESDCSDVSDIYSNEDLHNVFLVNKERIDLFNTPPSVENTLCHKLGDLEIQTSDLTTEYEKHFLFKDLYIKDQLRSLKLMNTSAEFDGTVLPASLLDYICCKRLEDNYNFYMDNIIKYVKHTIEQLKRISNGDYLTDKAKEKWHELDNATEDPRSNTKVLATSTSIPLHVERKIGGRKSTWDDIVHSAVDIRSLSKILEKKIVLEVPKILCGSYKLLSKCCTDNVIISCKKEKRPVEERSPESRVDVVFQLQRSEKGQVMSNISSIMILKTTPAAACDTGEAEFTIPLPLPYIEVTKEKSPVGSSVKIIELDDINTTENLKEKSYDSECSDHLIEDTFLDSIDYACSDNDGSASLKNSSLHESSDSSDALKDILDRKPMFSHREASCDVFPDDLRLTIQKLTMQSALTEESGEDMSQSTTMKRKSPTRARIKSPYENQSYIMEEKKRRKLLEIRERRERKKMALAENCKITKHKYGKGAIMPQSASSVTKLSISNKSFYNSIYGQSTNVDPTKQPKGRNRKGGKREGLDIGLEGLDGEHETTIATPEKNNKKYINRSYYLDDAVTEMMYMNMKRSESDGKDLCSTSTSVISNDFRNNLNLLSQLIGPSETELDICDDDITIENKIEMLDATTVDDGIEQSSQALVSCKAIVNIVPSNSPNVEEHDDNDQKKVTASVECRKSIDKIYTLMKSLGKADTESKSSKSKSISNNTEKTDTHGGRGSSTFQGSDSGTSLKHHLTSSNPSYFSFEKNNADVLQSNKTYHKPGSPTAVVPKVIISSKSSSQTPKTESDKNKKDKRKVTSPPIKIPDNPLKAISQLLHEFENVQKTRQKPFTEQKPTKKQEIISSDGKSGSRQSSFKRRSRLDQHNEAQGERYVRVSTPKERKNRVSYGMDITKIPYQQSPVDDKHVEKIPKKKLIDVLDEVKEARGEAVRGPSKLNSRLNSLAQPKRTYVQAHSEEYQIKYGKTLMADRLQRLAAAPPPTAPDRNPGSANSRNKVKRSGTEAISTVSVKLPQPPVPPLERAVRTRHSTSCSPEVKERLNLGMGPSFKQITVPETPQTLKKKMVAVESYVKNHYGRTTSSVVNEPQSAQKSRVPLVPNDIELASTVSSPAAEESTELGSRLHHIINSIIKTTSPGLEVLAECQESNSKISKENTEDYSLAENLSRSERVSSESDYTLDILDDNNVLTSVENIDKASENEQKQINVSVTDAPQYELQPFRSVTELEKLEQALCHHIPVGTFQKRLRIKNLTLTPKQSMQQVFVLQSGDAGSLVVQTPIVHSFKEPNADKFADLKALRPVLSKPHLDWNFGNFPMQVSTVGYAFPEYKSIQCGSTSLVQLFDEVSKSSEDEKPLLDTIYKSDKDNQCFKGGQSHLVLEQAAQVNVPALTLVTVGISSTHIIKPDEKGEEKQCEEGTNIEPKQVAEDCSEKKAVADPIYIDQTQTNTNECNNNNIKDTTKPVLNKESGSTAVNPEDIEYTTSLDILVGLLNEIQKITTCQTLMTNGDKNQNENQENKELETILNKAAALENSLSPCEAVSFTSLDRLRQLESNPSIYSFYLSDNEGSEKNSSKMNFPSEIFPLRTEELFCHKPISPSEIFPLKTEELFCPKPVFADKEVSVDLLEREYVSRFTDVPSQFFPISMNHSTNVTNSLIGVLSEPSTQSMFSFAEYHSVYSNASPLSHKNIDLPQIIISRESNQALTFYEVNDEEIEKPKENNDQSLAFYEVNNKAIEKANENNSQSLNFYEVNAQAFKKPYVNKSYKKKIQSFEERIVKNGKITNSKFHLKTDFDPLMKMKRDILVTVYSILVFTVFAALSFPEIMYRV